MITLEDYVLTNLSLKEHCFTIRLKDNNEYIVYHRKPRGQKTIYYIEKDGKMVKLSYEVQKAVMSSIREYERYGI